MADNQKNYQKLLLCLPLNFRKTCAFETIESRHFILMKSRRGRRLFVFTRDADGCARNIFKAIPERDPERLEVLPKGLCIRSPQGGWSARTENPRDSQVESPWNFMDWEFEGMYLSPSQSELNFNLQDSW
jgi:hypothetical protein